MKATLCSKGGEWRMLHAPRVELAQLLRVERPETDSTAALAGSGGASLAELASRHWRRCHALTSARTHRRRSCRRRGVGARACACTCIASTLRLLRRRSYAYVGVATPLSGWFVLCVAAL